LQVHNTGWGVFSRNLLRQMLASRRHTPLLTVPLEVRFLHRRNTIRLDFPIVYGR
jgi:hypothetical protein